MLLDDTTDPNESAYTGKREIDRSIGYLVGGVAVMLFFLLTVLGMGRVQTMTDKTVGVNRDAPDPKSADINDSTNIAPPRSE